jgi:hypothetical protein
MLKVNRNYKIKHFAGLCITQKKEKMKKDFRDAEYSEEHSIRYYIQ